MAASSIYNDKNFTNFPYFTDVNFTEYAQIVCPLLINGNHRTVDLISMLTEQISYIDPMGSSYDDLDSIIRTWFSFSRKRNDIYSINGFNMLAWSIQNKQILVTVVFTFMFSLKNS